MAESQENNPAPIYLDDQASQEFYADDDESESDLSNLSDEDNILQLKITLKKSFPKIWRRIQVPGAFSFELFHRFIQQAMGWRDCHLHHFETPEGLRIVSKQEKEMQEGDQYDEYDTLVETEMDLFEYFNVVGSKMVYVYDMGDWWEHEIVLEKVLPVDQNVIYPICIGGKRACPPEDCGGVYGYEHLLNVINDPSHHEHDDLTSWLENLYPGFDPEKFDKENLFINSHFLASDTDTTQ